MTQAQQTNRKALDEYVNRVNLTDQNYDNAMNAANTEITNMLANRLTNAANTYNLNTTYDNYQIDPRSGGMNVFPGGRILTGSQGTDEEARKKQLFEFMKEAEAEAPGMSKDDRYNSWKEIYGNKSGTSGGYPTSTNNYYGSNYGSRYGKGYNAGYQGGYQGGNPYHHYNPYFQR